MKEFDKLYLSWRKGLGTRRFIVGVINQTPDQKFVFSYDENVVNEAKQEGFAPYTEFPDISKKYNGNVLEIFGQRLMKSERPDIQSFYDFWEIDASSTHDKFYLLGHTQGLLPTDNFELLADYNPTPGLRFLTEIAGLSKYNLPSDTVRPGDILTFEIDNGNKFDPDAVKIFKDDMELGYIKKIHCRLFHKPNAENLTIEVKALDKNGIIKRLFVKVSQ